MTKRILGVAQIGCGAFAQSVDMPNFRDHPQVECLWCCDQDIDRARALAVEFAVPDFTDDFDRILGDPRVDFIKISTTHEARYSLIAAAARAGKHVFCEKPLALDERECLDIIREVRHSGIKLCVDLNRRAAPALTAMRARWQQHLQTPHYSPWRYIEGAPREPLPEENQTQFLIRIQDESSSYRLTHLDPLHGGGQIIGETIHWLDLACWWFAPQLPTEITAWGSTRLSHGINLKFSGGDTATILFDCGGTFDYPKETYEVASGGMLFRSLFFVENEYFGSGSAEQNFENATFPLRRDDYQAATTREGFAGYNDKYFARVKNSQNSKMVAGALQVDKGHAALLDAFIFAIDTDGKSPCDELDGYRSTHLARLAIRSIELRQSLPVLLENITPRFA